MTKTRAQNERKEDKEDGFECEWSNNNNGNGNKMPGGHIEWEWECTNEMGKQTHAGVRWKKVK